MNLVLLADSAFTLSDQAVIQDPRQLEQLRRVRKPQIDDRMLVGRLNGRLGEALVTEVSPGSIRVKVEQYRDPPPPLPLILVLALPRPQQLKRILETLASTGVKELHLIHSRRVEKSYWQSPRLTGEAIREQLWLGLEQGCDTQMPRVELHKRFRSFVEDRLPHLMQDRLALLAHPYNSQPCPARVRESTLLMVGPEGGFNDFEVELLCAQGLQPVHLGERILKTETAIPFLLGRLF